MCFLKKKGRKHPAERRNFHETLGLSDPGWPCNSAVLRGAVCVPPPEGQQLRRQLLLLPVQRKLQEDKEEAIIIDEAHPGRKTSGRDFLCKPVC
jgi:hypothetical protein